MSHVVFQVEHAALLRLIQRNLASVASALQPHQHIKVYHLCCGLVACPHSQVDHAALLRLIKKSPTVLKLNAAKVQQHAEFLAELGGLSPQQVYKAYVNWPVLMTISVPLLKAR